MTPPTFTRTLRLAASRGQIKRLRNLQRICFVAWLLAQLRRPNP